MPRADRCRPGGRVRRERADARATPGVKGAGEAGCCGAPAAIVNAVLDALAEYGVTHIDMPLTPHEGVAGDQRNSGLDCMQNPGQHEERPMSAVAEAETAASMRWQDQVYDLLRQHNVTQFAYVPDAGPSHPDRPLAGRPGRAFRGADHRGGRRGAAGRRRSRRRARRAADAEQRGRQLHQHAVADQGRRASRS